MIDNQFEIGQQIGKGGSSYVFSASDYNGDSYAVKIIRKDKNYSHERAEHFILRESFVMGRIGDHPNIVKSISCSTEGQLLYQGENLSVMYHVLELCKNGSLNTFIKSTGAVEEKVSKLHFLQIAYAIQHMHSQGFAHLDIKLDNILLDEFYNAKLADLGCAHCVVNTKGRLNLKVGTLNYISPEVDNLGQNETYDALKADIYSLGVLLYVMLTGSYPEIGDKLVNSNSIDSLSTGSESTNSVNVDQDENNYKAETINQNLSPQALSLLTGMLAREPEKRFTIEDVLSHSWLSMSECSDLGAMVYSEFEARKMYMMQTTYAL